LRQVIGAGRQTSIQSTSPPPCWPLTQDRARADSAPCGSPGMLFTLGVYREFLNR